MSRRKQAKPRSLKVDLELAETDTTIQLLKNTTKSSGESTRRPLTENTISPEKDKLKYCKGEDSGEDVKEDGLNYVISTPDVPCDTNDSLESALGTERASSWRSETPEDVQTSPTPSSCPTPSSTSDLAESDLTFTIGATESTPYVCQFCDKAFPRLSFLKKHEQIHGDLLPFRCEYCSRLFKHKRSRDRHIKLHTGDKKYRCTNCEAAFSRSDHLKIHMKTHDNQKPFQCTHCSRGYNTAAALTSHILNHKKRTVAPSADQETVSSTENQSNHSTVKHKQAHHSIYQTSNGATQPDQINIETMPVAANLTCMYCAKDNFSTMEQLRQHVQSWHSLITKVGEATVAETPPIQYNFQESTVTSSSSSSSSNSNNNNVAPVSSPDVIYSKSNKMLLFCNMCTMRFSTPANLKAHQMIVHQFHDANIVPQQPAAPKTPSEILPLICIECSMSFTTTSNFSEHILNVHGNGSPNAQQTKPTDLSKKRHKFKEVSKDGEIKRTKHDIDKCNSTNNNINNNVNQFEHHHRSSTTFICNQCNAAKPNFESFRQHLKTHIEGCASGVRSLLQAGELLAMLQSEGPGLSCYCPQCGTTVDQNQFNKHYTAHFLNTTVEYGCQHCKKAFQKPDELQKHLMDMHAHRLFKCTLCKEIFESQVELQVHFAVNHSNECTTYRCIVCPNTSPTVFNSLHEFDMHVQVYHNQYLKTNIQQQSISCPNCPLTFHSVQDMHNHALTHRQSYQCFICLKRFSIEFLLDRHMQQCHSPLQVSNQMVDTDPSIYETNAKQSIPSKTSPNLSHSKLISPSKQQQKPSQNNNNVEVSKISDTNNCDICNRNDFSNELELFNHRKLVHHLKMKVGTVSLHCAYCNENCKSRTELENHMKTHSQTSGGATKHKCNICDEICPSAEILAQHKLTHCKVVSGNACTQCKTVLTNEEMFYNHVLQHSNSSNTTGASSGAALKSAAQIMLPTPCVICRQTLIAEIEVQYHAKFHLKISSEFHCVICCKIYDKKNGILTHAFGQMPSYTCKDCYVHYHSPEKSVLNGTNQKLLLTSGTGNGTSNGVDIKTENNNKKYSCIKCQESFDSETAIQNHVALHVMADGCSHECHLCRQVLASPVQLQAHLIEHTFAGCGSYTCYICSSVFTTVQGLQNHIMEHGLAAKPYDCRQCSLKFFFRAELDNHAYSHIHEINFTGEGFAAGYPPTSGPAAQSSAGSLASSVAPVTIVNGLEKNEKIKMHGSHSPCICSNCNFTFSTVTAYEKHVERCPRIEDKHRAFVDASPPAETDGASSPSLVTVKTENTQVTIKTESM